MSPRRWGVGLAVVAAIVVAIGIAIVLLQPIGGPELTHRSEAGGFTIDLPGGWRLVDADPGKPWMWLRAERATRLGTVDAWLWVNRLAPVGDDPLTVGRAQAMDDVREQWGDVDVEVEATTIAGNRAVSLRYSHPIVDSLDFIPANEAEEIRYVTMSEGHVYEIGVGGWRSLPSVGRELDDHLRFTTPTGSRPLVDATAGFAVEVPADWNWTGPRDDGPVWTATAPPSTPNEWGAMWKYEGSLDDAVADSVAKAKREGTLVGRTRTRIDGRPASRVDFDRPADDGRTSHASTWLFEGPDGRVWQLLVGSWRDDRSSATRVAAGLRFL